MDPNARDKDGRLVLMVFTKCYNTKRTSPMDFVRAIYYLLDRYLTTPELQRVGFSAIVDCSDSSYSNFDPHMPKVVLKATVGTYPARVGHVMIINVPWFFKFVWGLITPLISEQLLSKFHITDPSGVEEFVDKSGLLPIHGGESAFDQDAWIRERCEEEGVPCPF